MSARTTKEETVVQGFDFVVMPSADDDKATKDPSSVTLQWYCAPESWNVSAPGAEGYGGHWKSTRKSSDGKHHDCHVLELYPAAKKDFWRKTYYRPVLVKDDGAVLYANLSTDQVYTVTTSFTLMAVSQFDQAGLFLRLDAEHWIKTGIEVVDGKARLSCVVTNGYSDWSTQPWEQQQEQTTETSTTSEKAPVTKTRVDCTIRVHCRTEGNYVVEACRRRGKDDADDWELVRICHVSLAQDCRPDPLVQHDAVKKAFCGPAPPPGTLWAGVFGCCPVEQPGDTKVVFTQFSITKGSGFDHTAE